MGFLEKWSRKAVETVKDQAKDVMTEDTAEKLDILGDVAKIGVLAALMISAFHGKHKAGNLPDFSSVTINNYYYGRGSK